MSKTNFNKEELEKFISEKYGEEISLMQIKEGMESQVYSFIYKDKEYILRINNDDYGFKKDEYAYNHFNSELIPVPNICEYGSYSDAFFCISEKAKGITYEDSDHETIVRLSPKVMELLDNISNIKIRNTSGYGKINPITNNGEYETFDDMLMSVLFKPEWNKVKEFCQNLSIDLSDVIEKFIYLKKYVPECRKFVHGDFSNNNLIVNETHDGFSGVIDWDMCGYGDPFETIAGANFWSKHLDCATENAKTYNERYKDYPNYFEIMKFYQLRIVLNEIYDNALEHDETEVLWCFDRAKDILDGNVLVKENEVFTKSSLGL